MQFYYKKIVENFISTLACIWKNSNQAQISIIIDASS